MYFIELTYPKVYKLNILPKNCAEPREE